MSAIIHIKSATHLLRPAHLLSQPIASCSLLNHYHSPIRSFTSTPRRFIAPGSPNLGLALKTEVREREAKTGEAAQAVGEIGKGVEGPHYQDQVPLAAAGANPLTDLSRTGPWTMMNPIYTDAELDTVKVVHRPDLTMSDRLVHRLVRFARANFNFFTGYTDYHIPDETLAQRPLPIEELRSKGQLLSPKQWLVRIIFLESIAGVPGMVGGTLRHLKSLRLLRRDGGWIHTLLEEAENERMHLLTFMTIAQPTWITRTLILLGQGVFYNAFFLTYLFSPKVAHKFVGALEEEAVRTYTHCISDISKGLVPEWENVPAPRIAIDYWRLPEAATLLDVIRAVRADEATHRFVNNTLADLDHKRDFNPFALGEASAEIRGTKYGFTREESAEFARQSQLALIGNAKAAKEALENQALST